MTRRMSALPIFVAVILLMVGAGFAGAMSLQSSISTVADYPLGDDTSRFDYQSFDPTTNRLYIAHLRAGSLIAFDTQSHTAIGTIGRLPGIHGVIAVPQYGM